MTGCEHRRGRPTLYQPELCAEARDHCERGATLSELAGVLGPTVGASRRYDGPMGKSDRALVFGALGLWAGFGGPFPHWTVAIMIVLALLLALTVANRVRAGLKEGGRKP